MNFSEIAHLITHDWIVGLSVISLAIMVPAMIYWKKNRKNSMFDLPHIGDEE